MVVTRFMFPGCAPPVSQFFRRSALQWPLSSEPSSLQEDTGNPGLDMQAQTLITNPEPETSRYPALANRTWTGLALLVFSVAAVLIYVSLGHGLEPAFVLGIVAIAIASLV